eukprot:8834285-Pyramimonas_sp.AAC.1
MCIRDSLRRERVLRGSHHGGGGPPHAEADGAYRVPIGAQAQAGLDGGSRHYIKDWVWSAQAHRDEAAVAASEVRREEAQSSPRADCYQHGRRLHQ